MYPLPPEYVGLTAANFVPSLEEAMSFQGLCPAPVRAVQVAPLSVEV